MAELIVFGICWIALSAAIAYWIAQYEWDRHL